MFSTGGNRPFCSVRCLRGDPEHSNRKHCVLHLSSNIAERDKSISSVSRRTLFRGGQGEADITFTCMYDEPAGFVSNGYQSLLYG